MRKYIDIGLKNRPIFDENKPNDLSKRYIRRAKHRGSFRFIEEDKSKNRLEMVEPPEMAAVLDIEDVFYLMEVISREKNPINTWPEEKRKEFIEDIFTAMPHLSPEAFGASLLHFPEHNVHPYVDVYKKVIRSELKDMEDFIEKLRLAVRSETVARSVSNFYRNSKKCYQGLLHEVCAILDAYSRVLSIRMDLAYRTLNPEHFPVVLDPVLGKQHLNEFMRHVQHGTGLRVLGYAWTMECGLHAGIHHHVWILLDGHRHQNLYAIGSMLKRHWEEVITDHAGRANICDPSVKAYKHLAIGMLQRGLVDERGLQLIAQYLTKPDFFLHYHPKNGGKTFGRSCFKNGKKKGLKGYR